LTTPCLTQHTYEGLVDELYDIKQNAVMVDADIFAAQDAAKAGKPAAAAAAVRCPPPPPPFFVAFLF
jgi:hypothetical protein